MLYDNILLEQITGYEREFNIEESFTSVEELMTFTRDKILDIFSKNWRFSLVIQGTIPGYKIIEIDNTLIEIRPCTYLNYKNSSEHNGILMKLKAVKKTEFDTYDFNKLVVTWIDISDNVARHFITTDNCWLPIPFNPTDTYNASLTVSELLELAGESNVYGKYKHLWARVESFPALRDEASKVLRAYRDEKIRNDLDCYEDISLVNGLAVQECINYLQLVKKNSYAIEPFLWHILGGHPLSFTVSRDTGTVSDSEIDKVTKAISILVERALSFELGIDSISENVNIILPTLELVLKEQGFEYEKIDVDGRVIHIELPY